MEIFNNILAIINNVILTVVGVSFGIQLIYILLFFLPYKKLPKAKTKHKFGIIICARNEESVIGDTIACLKNLNYPKELYDIFVVAHNCTDNTKQVAEDAGAIVFECYDDNPKHKRVAYALKYGFEQILNGYDNYEAFVRFDADNLVDKDYLEYMNDAFDAGYHMARGYNASKNFSQNVVTGISGLWYLRDTRFTAHVRKSIHLNQFLLGPGMMFSAKIIREDGGWTKALGLVEDQEFALKQLYKKYKSTYVKEAVVYDDQPSTIKDTYNRYTRIGKGTWDLFWTDGLKCLGKFFVTFNFSYLDAFLTLLFIPIALIMIIWMPLYYGYWIIFNAIIGNTAVLLEIAKMVGIALVFAYLIPFWLQGILVVALERKRLGKENMKGIWKTILLFPAFMIIYAISIAVGCVSKPNWKQIKRNKVVTVDDVKTKEADVTVAKTEDESATSQDNYKEDNKEEILLEEMENDIKTIAEETIVKEDKKTSAVK